MPRKDVSAHSVFNPRRLNAKRFAGAGAVLQGSLPMAELTRLSRDLHDQTPGAANVQWSARGEMKPGPAGVELSPWLHLQAQAVLPLTCQRCLGEVEHAMEIDRWFRFVPDEATAELQDDDCEEDLLALEPRPDLMEVVQDELIMALPLVPMHEECPIRSGHAVTEAPEAQASERPHPFAALASLKGKP